VSQLAAAVATVPPAASPPAASPPSLSALVGASEFGPDGTRRDTPHPARGPAAASGPPSASAEI
jgi:hypothetical protein